LPEIRSDQAIVGPSRLMQDGGMTEIPSPPLSRGVTMRTGNAGPAGRLTIRVDLGAHGALGPGKIRLMELIGETGSISAAGRAMGMSYRRAWLLVDSLNRAFRAPVVATQHGGTRGGGAALTPLGAEIVERYRLMEKEAHRAAAGHLDVIVGSLSADASAQ
jgi:molybdate transport system regulatory protein